MAFDPSGRGFMTPVYGYETDPAWPGAGQAEASGLYGLLGVEDPRKQEALRMGLLQGGLGILANAYSPYGGGGLAAIGRGGLMGVDAYQQALQQQQQQEFQNFRIEAAKQEFNRQQEELQSQRDYLDSLDPKQRQLAQAAGVSKFAQKQIPEQQAPTPLERLIAARDALPEGDPRIEIFNDAISKASTHAPAQRVVVENYPAPTAVELPSGEAGMVQFGNKGSVNVTPFKPFQKPSEIKLTDAEAKATGYYNRMQTAEQQLA